MHRHSLIYLVKQLRLIITVFIGMLLHVIQAKAQDMPALSPFPAEFRYEKENGSYILDSASVIHTSPESEKAAELFAAYLLQHHGIRVQVQQVIPGTRNSPLTEKSILLAYSAALQKKSGYQLSVTGSGITIMGDSSGIFYGLQTLQQLIPSNQPQSRQFNIQGCEVKDYPRFSYRGMHLDVGRHMFSTDYVKKYIDFLAWHKFNYFHWHLTEDQGWRIEIDKYPNLTVTGSRRKQTLAGRYGSDKYDGKPYGGYYTKQEIRDIVRYAADRHITVIPEVDMPGHSLAALASYPYLGCSKGPYDVMQTWGVSPEVLCAGNDSTYQFVTDVLTELMELFPSPYIHIGGDECPKERWKKCPDCQARIKKEGLANEHELQSYFIRRVERFVNSKGRTIIGWDEILEGGLAPNAVVMSWRGEQGGIQAAKMHHDVIMTPETPLYLNHAQSLYEDSITQGGFNPIEKVYAYDPVPKALTQEQSKYILGAQGNLWSEYISNEAKLEYMLFPRISALAEALWSPKEKKDWEGFSKRLPGIIKRYALWKVKFSTAYYDLQPAIKSLPGVAVFWELTTNKENARIWWTADSASGQKRLYQKKIPIKTSGTYGAYIDHPDLPQKWIWQTFSLNKATAKKVILKQEPNKSYSLGGANSLVDGIQNTLGMLKSAQFLGFNGRDFEATIDLEKMTHCSEINLHAFEQTGSWIYRPKEVRFSFSKDGKNFIASKEIISITGSKNLLYRLRESVYCRYIRIEAINPGIIADGLPGAGHNAWIFFDEITVF